MDVILGWGLVRSLAIPSAWKHVPDTNLLFERGYLAFSPKEMSDIRGSDVRVAPSSAVSTLERLTSFLALTNSVF